MSKLPNKVTLVEVGARDGLQFEQNILSTHDKIELINRLSVCGYSHIEAGSFVNPASIPQLADSDAVFGKINRKPGVRYSALVPNIKGMQRAFNAKVNAIAVFTAASESFCQKNIRCSIDESLSRFAQVIDVAKQHRLWIRGYVSCVLGCPYEGSIKPHAVKQVAKQLFKLGCDEISLGDTIGVGTPMQAQSLVQLVSQEVPIQRLAVHFHDTRGQALANILACLEIGVTTIDSSIAGLGGCPYANGASGNVATEDVVYMLHGMGIHTGLDLQKIIVTGNDVCEKLQRKNASKVALAGIIS